jgi:hypothetical protein
VRVYVASKAKRAEIAMWRALRGAGVPIVSSWIDSEINQPGHEAPTLDDWAMHWQRCLAKCTEADVVLFYAPEGATQCGSLIEIGAALAAGRATVFVVSDCTWSIANHPRCRVFSSIEEAVAAIAAMAAGEKARSERSNAA